MADYQNNLLASLQGGWNFGQQIKQQRDTNQLNQLAALSYSAPTEQRSSLLGQMAAISPAAAQQQQKAFASEEERRNTTMVNMAKLLTNAPEQARPGLYRQMVPTLAKFGLSDLPQQYDAQTAPIIDQAAQSLVQAYSGGASSNEEFTLSPGSKRFDAAGNVLAEVPFAPANANVIDVPDGMGGSMKMIWDPRERKLSDLPGSGQRPVMSPTGVGPAGNRYSLGSDLNPDELAAAQADIAAGGTLDNVTLPDRQVATAGRMGYTPPKERDAPAGYAYQGHALAPIPGGPADNSSPQAIATSEQGLRKEVTQNLKEDQGVLSMYRNVQAAAGQPSAAGDLSLIFAFMKMLDPGSVVREQEFANAQNAAGVPDQVRNAYNKAISGQRLNPTQRQDFLNQAAQLATNAEGRITGTTRKYQDIARQYGYDPVRGTGMADFSGVTSSVSGGPESSVSPARPQTDADFKALPSGSLYIDPDDGRTYRKR
ncbi:hypothetical protein ACS0OX_17240 [Stenotrophomonas pavanii]|uniref:hypothetical protein n=1 Tax=Stenotrophomonas pavanii TaxID=487698 RepID=UPI003F9A85DA